MSRAADDRGDPRRDDPPENDIRDALQHAVADVEPAYRLDQIRARTSAGATEEGTMKDNARTWLVGAGGAVLATAAVIVTFAVVGGGGDDGQTPTAGEPTSSAAPSQDVEPDPTPSEVPEETSSGEAGGGEIVTVPAYYTVDTTAGPRLVREFRRAESRGGSRTDLIATALVTATTTAPADPDYSTAWPEDTTVEVTRGGAAEWTVVVASESTDLSVRPDGVDGAAAELMRQQLVYTAQAVLQERVPIALATPGGGSLLGVAGTSAASATDELEVLALMNVTTPFERQSFSGDTMTADGRSSGFEASVAWEVRTGGADGTIVERGVTQAEGWIDGLYPWTADVDISGLEPGEYTFIARNDDPTGGTEGVGDSADTKTFVVE